MIPKLLIADYSAQNHIKYREIGQSSHDIFGCLRLSNEH